MRIEQGRFGNLELQSIGFQVARMLKQQNDRLDGPFGTQLLSLSMFFRNNRGSYGQISTIPPVDGVSSSELCGRIHELGIKHM